MKIRKHGNKSSFDPQALLNIAGVGGRTVEFRRGQSIFSLGNVADSVMYIQKGGVQFSVVNSSGKKVVVAIFGPNDFFGEGCMAGQAMRIGTATAISPTTILVIAKDKMLRVLHSQRELSEHFIAYMLAHNIRLEEDLIDQLCSSSEKRLARTLLLLAGFGKRKQPDHMLPRVSQKTLAEMIGTTRSRVNFFLNRFRRRRFINYKGRMKVNKSLLKFVLQSD